AGRLRFAHDKLREVAYERIEPSRRNELHRAAAQAIESRFGGQHEEQLAILGDHWDRAGVPEKARPCYLSAARRAAARYVHGEAGRLYQAYLSLTRAPDPESVAARIELARDVLALRGRNQEVGRECRRALEEARLLEDRLAEGAALSELAELHDRTGQSEEACRLYEEALEIYRKAG